MNLYLLMSKCNWILKDVLFLVEVKTVKVLENNKTKIEFKSQNYRNIINILQLNLN